MSQLCVKCLVAIGQMLEALDRNIVIDQILPKVVQIRSREPGVLMGILGERQGRRYLYVWMYFYSLFSVRKYS